MQLNMPARARTGTSTSPIRLDQQSWAQMYNYACNHGHIRPGPLAEVVA